MRASHAWQAAGSQRYRGKQPSGRHVDPDWVNKNSLLFSYYVKRKQIQPQARNVRYVGQGEHYVFNAVEN